MRVESRATTISWIPSEAVTGLNKVVFGTGFTHYDDPPPDGLGDLAEMSEADMFRFANDLSAWIEVEDGSVTDAGYTGGCVMGSTTIQMASKFATYAAVPFPDICRAPEIAEDGVRFVQTVGGHTALAAPRRVNHPPFVKLQAPTVWTTLALTIRADGTSDFELVGASQFPRHWVYDEDGRLSAKAGLADFKGWYRKSFGKRTPWGDEESPAFVTAVETGMEREVASRIMRKGEKPKTRKLKEGSRLTEQGEPGDEVYLLLDGVLTVEVGGEMLAEIGPGAILGERAVLEGGKRSATTRALTKARVAVAKADQIDRTALAEISSGHRREERAST